MVDPRTPVLVGGGQITQRTAREGKLSEGLDPISLLAKAAQLAFADSGAAGELACALDTVAVVRFTADSPGDQGRLPKRVFRNPPLSVSNRLGIAPRRVLYTATGGNTPQWLVNRTAEEIACGECDAALLVGGECLATHLGAIKQGLNLGWGTGEDGDPGSDPQDIGDMRAGTDTHEKSYGLNFPVNAYPLFENAIRGKRGRDPDTHLKELGRLFSPLSRVAAENVHSWFPVFRSPEDISTPSESNRFVGFPYTKYLNAVIEVDMAAAILMMSVTKARDLRVPQSKWIFLHGCADANEVWHITKRADYHSSPAIRMIGKIALGMAARRIGDIAYFDLYSCFPSAVELACREMGIAEDDPRGLTVTGGLPYFGGPGNNYVMHAIVTMMEKLRQRPGTFGLCTGNGWYATKHSAGIYSTAPVRGSWRREAPDACQRQLDAMANKDFTEVPAGPARIETYTIATDRKGRRFGIVVGRLENGRRFLANTSDDNATLNRMMREEMLGRVGTATVTPHGNVFQFA